jgi:hypothetical protein
MHLGTAPTGSSPLVVASAPEAPVTASTMTAGADGPVLSGAVPIGSPSLVTASVTTKMSVGSLSAPSSVPIPAKVVPAPPVDNSHAMHTRGKSEYWMPVGRLNLQASALSPLAKTYHGALTDLNWRDAMTAEFTAIQANNTWELVP